MKLPGGIPAGLIAKWATACLAISAEGCQMVRGTLDSNAKPDSIAIAASLYFADYGPLDHLADDRLIPDTQQMGAVEQFRILNPDVARRLEELSRQYKSVGARQQSVYTWIGVVVKENGMASTHYREVTSAQSETFDSMEASRILHVATSAYMQQCEKELARRIPTSKLLRIVADSRTISDDSADDVVSPITLELLPSDLQIPRDLSRARPPAGGGWLTRMSVRVLLDSDQEKTFWCDLPVPSPVELQTMPHLRESWTKLLQHSTWRPATDDELRPRVRIVR